MAFGRSSALKDFDRATRCMIIDSFDVQALGYRAPALIKDWTIAGAAVRLVRVLIGSPAFNVGGRGCPDGP